MQRFRATWSAVFALLALLSSPPDASEARDRKQRSLFMQSHPCPANGHIRGKCPGYLIGHVTPLCAGGADRWSNMQWVARADAKAREEEERKQCDEFKRLVEGKGGTGGSK